MFLFAYRTKAGIGVNMNTDFDAIKTSNEYGNDCYITNIVSSDSKYYMLCLINYTDAECALNSDQLKMLINSLKCDDNFTTTTWRIVSKIECLDDDFEPINLYIISVNHKLVLWGGITSNDDLHSIFNAKIYGAKVALTPNEVNDYLRILEDIQNYITN